MEADYVIVGAGSAGCALAYRLSEAGHSVIVIEAGGSDVGPFIRMPAALSYPMNMARYDWGFRTEPEPHLGGRMLATPRGKVIGGSSSINGMVYVRGHPMDYEHWQEAGAKGWAWADVAPYFRRMECWHGGTGDPSWRGHDGPVHVTRGPADNPLARAFLRAGAEAGLPLTDDPNGPQQEGFGPMEATIWRGRRWSAAFAYLRPALRRVNCDLVTGMARRIVWEGRRARGVEIDTFNGLDVVRARREVIVAASSINSPKLLMLSGIGPAQHLRDRGVEVVADRPGVGRNLQDHLEIYVQNAASKPVSLFRHWNLRGKALVGARWLFLGTGLGASNQFEAGAFLRSSPAQAYPDVQFHFIPIAVRYDGRAAAEGHGFQIHTGPMRSPSRGAVTLRSPDPAVPPVIRFNYMERPEDWRDFRAAIRLARRVFAQEAFAPFRGPEIGPGAGARTDEALDEAIRAHCESAYHPCGTCRMGAADDPLAVVDPDLRVIGVEGLRVADSSVFPRVTNGNLNAPSLMTGEKAADHVLGRRLSRDERPWADPVAAPSLNTLAATG